MFQMTPNRATGCPFLRGWWLVSVLLPLLCFSLASEAVAQRRIIRMAVVDLNYRPAFEAVAREYMKLHPDVDVRIQIISTGGYATWIRTALAGGAETAPDIYSANFGSGFYESGKAINLKPYLDSVSPYTGSPWGESFIPQFLEMLSHGRDFPQIPLNYVEIGIFYNQRIFDEVGVSVPNTWEEFMEVCQAIKDAGYIPVAMPGDKESYWGGVVGWVVRLFTDAWFYDVVPEVIAREGDFLFDPLRDADFEVDYEDPFNDLLVSLSPERRIQAILDGRLAFDGPRMRELYTFLREFSRYWQRGFHGADPMSVYNLFLSQRAAMMFNASPAVLVLERDVARLGPRERFEWGAFHPPRVTTSPIVQTPFRGVGAPLPVYGVLRKSREQNDQAVDFLMYLTSPDTARLIVEESARAEEAIVGPFAIKDVQLDEELDAKFRPFLGHGREKLEIRGLEDEQESVWRWSTLAQDYMADRLTIDQFLERYQRLMVQAIPSVVLRYQLDMNPTTRDNNGPLITEVTQFLDQVKAGDIAILNRENLEHFLSDRFTEIARDFQVLPGSDSFDFLVERTVPIRVYNTQSDFNNAIDNIEKTTRDAGYQFAALVLLKEHGSPDFRIFNFRPSVQEVLRGLSGERYSSEELQRLFR